MLEELLTAIIFIAVILGYILIYAIAIAIAVFFSAKTACWAMPHIPWC